MNLTTITKKCHVCGDKASGFNFNGLSCESCRLFFMRNAHRHENLSCPVNLGKCEVNIENRNCCQRCRLDKCVSIGMRKELIKGKYSIQKFTKYPEPNLAESEDVIQLNESKIFTRYLQQNELEKLHEIQSAMSVICEENSLAIVRPGTALVDAYNISTLYIKKIIKFCKNIQAFKGQQECDQLVMFKDFFSYVQTIRFAFAFDLQNDRYPMFLDEGEGILIKMRIFRQWRRKNVESFFRRLLFSLQAEMENDSVVRNLFIAHALFKPRDNVTCPELIRYHYHVYRHLLKRYFEHKYYGDYERASKRYDGLMQLLSDLVEVQKLCKEIFADVYFEQQTNHDLQVLDEIFLNK